MRRLFLLVVMAGNALAQGPVVSPGSPRVAAGKSLQLTANRSVTWSLAPGSVGTISPTGVYTAPSTIPVKQKAGGCQVLPAASIFNTRVDALPIHANNTTWMNTIATLRPSGVHLNPQPSFGLNIVDNSTPTKALVDLYTPNNSGDYPLLPFPNLIMEGGYFTFPFSNIDRHITSVNRQTCEFSEIYNTYTAGINPDYPPTVNTQSSVKYSGNGFELSAYGTTDAAGLPLQPLIIRLDDILSGSIQHMSRITMGNDIIAPSFVWPATSNAGAGGTIPYGTILRLKSSFNISGFSPIAQMILLSWQRYGLIISDGGGTIDVQTERDLNNYIPAFQAMMELRLKSPDITHFEFVDQNSLMVSPSSSAVKYNNAYQVPDSYAVVIATDNLTSQKSFVYVALQAVTVGTSFVTMNFQAGTPATQIVSWVNGSSNQGVTWTMSPSIGTLSSGGIYTPPSTILTPTVTTLTGTSVVDSTATVRIRLTVWPQGTIRVNMGATSDIVDEGNTWFADPGWNATQSDTNYFPGGWASGTSPIYYDTRYTFGDTFIRFNLPNGNYKLTLKRGDWVSGGGPRPLNQYVNTYDAQGQIVYHELDLATLQPSLNAPVDLDLPLWVQDGKAVFSIRQLADSNLAGAPAGRTCTITGSNQPCGPFLNAFSIAPDAAPPHITIDGTIANITAGHTRQFYAVGWYMPNTVTWSVIAGPGSVDSNGLYTAPSNPPVADTTVTIQAVSTVDSASTAQFSFTFTFGSIVVIPNIPTLTHGLSQQFLPLIEGVPYGNVTWSISPPIGSIDGNGIYTAPLVLASDTPVTIIAQSNDDPSKVGSIVLTILATTPPIRVNCGGTAFTSADGKVWSTDSGFAPPEGTHGTISYSHYEVPVDGASVDMQQLYQSHRYSNDGMTPFYYQFSVPPGVYRVTLKFADVDFNESGHYVFDVKINGTTVLSGFDPDVAAGKTKTAHDEVFLVQESGQTMRIDFAPNGSLWPSVSGIEIIPDDTAQPAGKRIIQGTSTTRGKVR